APLFGPADGIAVIEHHNERRKVSVGAAQTVIYPGAERGTAAQNRAAIHLGDSAEMVDAVGPTGSDDRHVVYVLRDVRVPVRNPKAALSMLLEGPLRGHQSVIRGARHGRELRPHRIGKRLAREFLELGLGV